MTDQSATLAGASTAPRPRLEPDAIGVAQDTVIGMASSAPAATIGLSLAGLAVATAYGSGPILILTAIPMLIIANAYRRCNMWNANCGASFEWVGRAINPYLGFLTGWLMVVAYIIGTVAEILLLGPSVLAVFGSTSTDTWAWIGIGTVVGVVMLVIAVIGIRITARVQVGMAAVEYLILIGLAIAGLLFVLGHHHGSFAITRGWFSVSGINGKGSALAGFLIAVFVYGGWDGTLYVNEEVKHRRVNPGRAAIIAVALLAIIYTLAQVGLQGVVAGQAGGGGQVRVRSGLRGERAGRRVLGEDDGAVHRAVGDRHHRHRHRAERPNRLRHGQLPGLARILQQRVTPVLDAGDRERHRRRAADRDLLDLHARDVGAERVLRRDRYDRPAVRDLLRPHGARDDRLLSPARVQRVLGFHHPRGASARRGWLPRLDVRAVTANAGDVGRRDGR